MTAFVRDHVSVGGAWVPSRGTGVIEVVNPATEEVLGHVPEGTAEDVDAAVAAARAAFGEWSSTSVAERVAVLERIAEGIGDRADELATTIAMELGAPMTAARAIQVGLAQRVFETYARLLPTYEFEESIGSTLVAKEPVGVVAAITPWNLPLYLIAEKVAPALAAGCTVVLKPSEVTPFVAYLFMELLADVGLPPGACNMVIGYGPVVGEALAAHPDVDMVSLTGSTAAGRRVAAVAAGTVKRVALELGGKSPNIALDDADLPTVVSWGITRAFANSGQTCTALTRLLVPRPALAEAEELAVAAAAGFVPGDPFDPATTLGPLVSAGQRDRVRSYIAAGLTEGATLVAGGAEPPEGLDRGYYVRPTVFSGVRSGMVIEQEEIFGPVLSIVPYDTEDEAVRIANDTIYGLSGAVWSADPERALRVARRVRTGTITVNGAVGAPEAPFGGFGQSGLGRERGRYGLDEYLEPKSVML